ncbi:MAG: hypothetical protein HY751_10065 [Nitrospinae bacterium]|nr:hypothetical protein [Nitrospinota bacterium]
MNGGRSGARFAFLAGIYFALLQTGYFWGLAVYMTSAYQGFATVTVAWLAGSGLGLFAGRFTGSPVFTNRWFWAPAGLGAFYLSMALLRTHPFDLSLIWAHGSMVAISGAGAGVFFADNRNLFQKTARLFYHENNGFVLGWLVGFAGFVFGGFAFSWLAPAAIAAIVTPMSVKIQRHS